MDYQASLDRQKSEDAHKKALELIRARNKGTGEGGSSVIIPIPPSRSSGVRGEAVPQIEPIRIKADGELTTDAIDELLKKTYRSIEESKCQKIGTNRIYTVCTS